MRLALNAITEELRRLKASGVGRIPVSDEGIAALRGLAKARKPETPASTLPAVAAPSAAAPAPAAPVVVLPDGDKSTRWAALRQSVFDDPVCKAKVRPGKKIVLGVGSLDASIMFVGEAPGAEEEIQGEPFVGPADQLLNRMIGGMGLSRSDVYIGNIMNWRPDLPLGPDGVQTGNRPPTDGEMAHCLPYLRAQIEIVNPRLLVALGTSAAKGLLGSKAFGSLGEVRGRWHDFGGRPLMVTYHPSYILRNPTNRQKRLIWEDLLKVMERASLPISEKQRRFFL
jgi:DNA polymerase